MTPLLMEQLPAFVADKNFGVLMAAAAAAAPAPASAAAVTAVVTVVVTADAVRSLPTAMGAKHESQVAGAPALELPLYWEYLLMKAESVALTTADIGVAYSEHQAVSH